jgi:ribosomal protein L15
MRAGQNAHCHHIHIFLHGSLNYLFRRLPKAGVNYFHAGVAKRPCQNFGSPVMPVQPRLGYQNPYRSHLYSPLNNNVLFVFAKDIAHNVAYLAEGSLRFDRLKDKGHYVVA